MVPKGGAGVFSTKKAAALQYRDHVLDEIVETGWKSGRHDIEPIGRAAAEPVLNVVGDLLGRSDNDMVSTA